MKRRFLILDSEVVLDGPDAAVAPIAYAYGRFLAPGEAGQSALCLTADHKSIHVDGRVYPFADGADSTLEIYQHFLEATLGRISSHAVLHAGALVTPTGEGLIVAGPSGHGKSTLTQSLVVKGWRFLSDDYAPVDLRRRTIAPYPRTIGLLADGAAKIPQAFTDAAGEPGVPHLFGKALVDVGRALGESFIATQPAPLRHVILLGSGNSGDSAPRRRVEVTCLSTAAQSIHGRLQSIAGLEVAAPVSRGAVSGISVEIDSQAGPTAELSRVAADEAVLFCQRFWEGSPDFSGEPRLTPVRRREAAEFLGQELLNRSPGSRLLHQYGGDLTALFLDLAAALRDARCYKLEVGSFEQSLALVEGVALRPMDVDLQASDH